MKISTANNFLEQAFDALNKQYFESALPKVMITIQSSPRAYGHFTTWEAWQTAGKKTYEINLGAETLNRPIANTIATLIHEMVHLYCHINNIKDTSRGNRYHNKRFKEEAEKRGLEISYDQTIGWSITQPTKELKSFIKSQKWVNKLNLNRVFPFGIEGTDPGMPGITGTPGTATGTKNKKPSSTRKYVCPICGQSIRATKEVNIICGDCFAQINENGEPKYDRDECTMRPAN